MTLRFTMSDQEWFAAATGDHNPLHVDPNLIRETVFEGNLVHGMHVVLHMLEAYLGGAGTAQGLTKLSCVFAKPVFLDEDLEIETVSDTGSTVKLGLRKDDVHLVRLTLKCTDERFPIAEFAACSDVPDPDLGPDDCLGRSPEGRRFSLPFRPEAGALHERFPVTTARLGPAAVAGLALMSTAVGMKWPGLRSLFASFQVTFHVPAEGQALNVVGHPEDERVSMITLDVTGPAFDGTVQAFTRPNRVEFPATETLTHHVGSDEFANQRALIIGAGQGIGAMSARLLALGGAELFLTYHNSQSGLVALKSELEAQTAARVHIGPYDVTCDRPSFPGPDLSNDLNAIYYFASPQIFLRRTKNFDHDAFSNFLDYYVTGATRAIEHCLAVSRADRVVLYYPSSVAIDEGAPELVEYGAAKLAGEFICQSLEKQFARLGVLVTRLPRMDTAQTNSVIRVPAAPIADTMLPVLKQMSELIDETVQ